MPTTNVLKQIKTPFFKQYIKQRMFLFVYVTRDISFCVTHDVTPQKYTSEVQKSARVMDSPT